MFKNILVPLDGAARSEQALAIASAIAKSDAAHITLLHIVEDSAVVFANPAGLVARAEVGDKLLHGEFARANEYLAEASEKVKVNGVGAVEEIMLRGIAHSAICEVANAGYDLVVMTAYGRSPVGVAPLGSMAAQVLRNTTLPVLLLSNRHEAGGAADRLPNLKTIIVPLDGSKQAEQAIPIAVSLAQEANATLILLGVTPPAAHPQHAMVQQAVGGGSVMVEIVPLGTESARPVVIERRPTNDYHYLSNTARQCIPKGLTYGVVEASNEPAQAILGNAERMSCDMVVMTAHGVSGGGPLSGLSEAVMLKSKVPVLLLRPAQT